MTTESNHIRNEEDTATISAHALKRPGLFAVKAILKNARGGWGKFSDLAETTEGVSNRRDFVAYLKLLTDLGWLKVEGELLPSRSRKQGRKSVRFYEVTDKGQAFLDLFPKEGGG